MISMFSDKEDVKNCAMPPHIETGVKVTSVISSSLNRMREQVNRSLDGIEQIDWKLNNS